MCLLQCGVYRFMACASTCMHSEVKAEQAVKEAQKWEMMNTLTFEHLDLIVSCCATSPMARHNGIAACSRLINTAWRRMHLRLVRAMIDNAIEVRRNDRDDITLLDDLRDII